MLDLAFGTGRRISAIRQLTYADLLLNEGPHGSIKWPARTDKPGFESVAPISPLVRAALDRIRQAQPGIAARPLCPDPRDPARPIPKHRPEGWLRQAEILAGLEKQEGTSLSPACVRKLVGDGSMGGYYERDDHEMMELWAVAVQETREILAHGWTTVTAQLG